MTKSRMLLSLLLAVMASPFCVAEAQAQGFFSASRCIGYPNDGSLSRTEQRRCIFDRYYYLRKQATQFFQQSVAESNNDQCDAAFSSLNQGLGIIANYGSALMNVDYNSATSAYTACAERVARKQTLAPGTENMSAQQLVELAIQSGQQNKCEEARLYIDRARIAMFSSSNGKFMDGSEQYIIDGAMRVHALCPYVRDAAPADQIVGEAYKLSLASIRAADAGDCATARAKYQQAKDMLLANNRQDMVTSREMEMARARSDQACGTPSEDATSNEAWAMLRLAKSNAAQGQCAAAADHLASAAYMARQSGLMSNDAFETEYGNVYQLVSSCQATTPDATEAARAAALNYLQLAQFSAAQGKCAMARDYLASADRLASQNKLFSSGDFEIRFGEVARAVSSCREVPLPDQTTQDQSATGTGLALMQSAISYATQGQCSTAQDLLSRIGSLARDNDLFQDAAFEMKYGETWQAVSAVCPATQ